MTEANAPLWLRRLRFPRDLEREFQEDYARKSLWYVRAIIFLVLLLAILRILGDLPWLPRSLPSIVWRVGVLLPLASATLAFSFTRWYPRLMQWTMGAVTLAIVVSIVLLNARSIRPPDHPHAEAGFMMMVLSLASSLFFVYTLGRLRFLAATAVAWIALVAFLMATVSRVQAPEFLPGQAVIGLTIVNVFGMAACYGMERLARSDFLANQLLDQERRKSDELLLNILPRSIAERLKRDPGTIGDSFSEVTVLFADLVDFTPLCSRLTPKELVTLLSRVFSCFDALADRHGLEKIKTIGDAYMAVAGLPEPRADHAQAMARMALEMRDGVARLAEETGLPLQVRIGMNSGPVVAGVIGTRKFSYDLWGDTVNLASRMESHGLAGSIQMTDATYRNLEGQFLCERRGLVAIKGGGERVTFLLRASRGTAGSISENWGSHQGASDGTEQVA